MAFLFPNKQNNRRRNRASNYSSQKLFSKKPKRQSNYKKRRSNYNQNFSFLRFLNFNVIITTFSLLSVSLFMVLVVQSLLTAQNQEEDQNLESTIRPFNNFGKINNNGFKTDTLQEVKGVLEESNSIANQEEDQVINPTQSSSSSEVTSTDSNSTRDIIYIVKSGDSLYQIALDNQVDFATLAEYNSISSPYTLNIGQEIRIPN
jgi:LysM repeat protein